MFCNIAFSNTLYLILVIGLLAEILGSGSVVVFLKTTLHKKYFCNILIA